MSTQVGYTALIHVELVRCCSKYNPEALGYWGLMSDGRVVTVEMLDGRSVRVDGAQTLAALRALPTASVPELVAKTLTSFPASEEMR